MIRLIINATSAELPDLLRLPEIARLVDNGRVSIQSDNVPPADDLSTRQRGRVVFEQRAREHGLEIQATTQPGVTDLLVGGASGYRPVRLICSESARLSLREEWGKSADLILAYVWVLPARPRVFLMSYGEAADVLGESALKTPSFETNGYYTTACTPRRQRAMEHFEDRWEIFEQRSK